jgi:DNA-binding PadR family transcriptional regulator
MTNAELAVLSLIIEKPRHGYEIEKVIEERGMRDWTEVSFSSIYYLLRKLAKEGMIAARQEPSEGGGPGRKVYHATQAGHRQWHDAMLGVLSTPQKRILPLQIGLAGLLNIPSEKALEALQMYHQTLSEQREYVKSRWNIQRGRLQFNVHAMFELSISLIDTEIEFLKQLINDLKSYERNNNDEKS